MSLKHILVVDDDAEIRDLLSSYLGQGHFQVHTAADGAAMWQRLERQPVDLIILDLMMPGDDGLELCRALRARSAVPIIILTARDSTTERIVGLELGADDYLTKPFDPRELLARIKAVLRRAGDESGPGRSSGPSQPEYLNFAGWRLDMRARQMCSPDGLVISLPSSDFHVLRLLLERPNQPLSRDYLIRHVFGRHPTPGDRAIDVCVSRLRQHLEPDTRNPTLIRTIRHEGYLLYLDAPPTA